MPIQAADISKTVHDCVYAYYKRPRSEPEMKKIEDKITDLVKKALDPEPEASLVMKDFDSDLNREDRTQLVKNVLKKLGRTFKEVKTSSTEGRSQFITTITVLPDEERKAEKKAE